MQITLPGNARPETAVESFKFGNELQESDVVTLVQRHQTNEALRLDDRLWNDLVVE